MRRPEAEAGLAVRNKPAQIGGMSEFVYELLTNICMQMWRATKQ